MTLRSIYCFKELVSRRNLASKYILYILAKPICGTNCHLLRKNRQIKGRLKVSNALMIFKLQVHEKLYSLSIK